MRLLQNRFVEFFPVVEVVEIDGVFAGAGIVSEAVGAEDRFAGPIVMDVALDCGIELVDGTFVELGGVFLHPGFEFAISGFALLDVVNYGIPVEAKAIDNHLVVTFASTRVAGGQFADAFEREFEPEARKVQNAKRTGNAGTDKWNNRIHSICRINWICEEKLEKNCLKGQRNSLGANRTLDYPVEDMSSFNSFSELMQWLALSSRETPGRKT